MPDKLIAVGIRFVPSDFKVRKKTFNRFLKGNSVGRKLIILKVILKIRWIEAAPVDHGSEELLSSF
jgi:hypothetical protein